MSLEQAIREIIFKSGELVENSGNAGINWLNVKWEINNVISALRNKLKSKLEGSKEELKDDFLIEFSDELARVYIQLKIKYGVNKIFSDVDELFNGIFEVIAQTYTTYNMKNIPDLVSLIKKLDDCEKTEPNSPTSIEDDSSTMVSESPPRMGF